MYVLIQVTRHNCDCSLLFWACYFHSVNYCRPWFDFITQWVFDNTYVEGTVFYWMAETIRWTKYTKKTHATLFSQYKALLIKWHNPYHLSSSFSNFILLSHFFSHFTKHVTSVFIVCPPYSSAHGAFFSLSFKCYEENCSDVISNEWRKALMKFTKIDLQHCI